mmetsp:Transcript_13497/g.18490  ORF Transcript_13497/g.18490 Transcript_13497/m.18490 type:complete len:84 (+) Transcript_13497:607-858(+)
MHLLQSTRYRIGLIIFNVLSISQFIILLFMINTKALLEDINSWIILAFVINTVFLIDLIAHLVVFGFRRLYKKKTEYLAEFLL